MRFPPAMWESTLAWPRPWRISPSVAGAIASWACSMARGGTRSSFIPTRRLSSNGGPRRGRGSSRRHFTFSLPICVGWPLQRFLSSNRAERVVASRTHGGSMLSRREILVRAGVAGAAALARPITAAFASAPEPKTPVNFSVPAGGCDCHTHIFDPGGFPYAASRPYTPETASIVDVRALHRALHIDRVVISQPTVYGTDHSCTLDAIKRLGRSARGVAA